MSSRTAIRQIEQLTARIAPTDLADLVSLFVECVDGGGSMGYLAPLPVQESAGYWRTIVAELSGGYRILIVAREAGRIVGSAQLNIASRPNGRHRAEVQKVMVRPSHRRRGLGTQLMTELESLARERGITLLHLDTSEGPGGARELYERLGYSYAGGIPDWALDPDGTPAQNAIFYKRLD
ncbi:MAG TPA: GNAT family N-acetyltransferase [Candidatus Limnocylindria bacterium]